MELLLRLKQELNAHVARDRALEKKSGHFSLETGVYLQDDLKIIQDHPRIYRPDPRYLTNDQQKIFHSSCPHRGARLKSSTDGFTCPYHGWTFNQDGSLLRSSGPHCSYKPGTLKMTEVPTKKLGGVVFHDPMDTLRGEFVEEIRLLSEGHEFLAERTQDVNCNWKFLVESLLETYHFPFAHSKFLAHFEEAFYSHHATEGSNARILVPMQDLPEKLATADIGGLNLMYFIFPSTFVLFMGSGHAWFSILPETTSRSRFTTSFFTAANLEASRRSFDLLDEILHQDFAILESQQENLTQRDRHYFTPYEGLIQHFHQRLKL